MIGNPILYKDFLSLNICIPDNLVKPHKIHDKLYPEIKNIIVDSCSSKSNNN
jgi:hypothetical protein